MIGAAGSADAAAIEAGRKLFAGECRFFFAATDAGALPPQERPEVAFAGRSNVGKSSLLNALTGRKALARVSKTPGRTRQIVFFDLARRLTLVDMPGYGFARVSKAEQDAWRDLCAGYLTGRRVLARVLALVDARHGIRDSDRVLFGLLALAGAPFQVVLTKADELAPAELAARVAGVDAEVATLPASLGGVRAVSARTGAGIAELRAALAELAAPPAVR